MKSHRLERMSWTMRHFAGPESKAGLPSAAICHSIVIVDHLKRSFRMRVMARIILLLAIASLTAGARSENLTVINKFIAAQAKREGGEEPDGVRKTIEGDLNHDGNADVAVLYTIEGQGGSNNYVQYLAVFIRTKTGLVFAASRPVGGKNRRNVDLTSIKNEVMYLDVMDYAKTDGSCCPSIKGATAFILMGRQLIEKHR
jgi:hypothetical protein